MAAAPPLAYFQVTATVIPTFLVALVVGLRHVDRYRTALSALNSSAPQAARLAAAFSVLSLLTALAYIIAAEVVAIVILARNAPTAAARRTVDGGLGVLGALVLAASLAELVLDAGVLVKSYRLAGRVVFLLLVLIVAVVLPAVLIRAGT